MARRRTEKTPPPPPPDDTGDAPLTGPALQLWHDANARWELDAVAARILRAACESLQLSNRCQSILDREGLTIQDRGRIVKHPCVVVGRDARCLACRSKACWALLRHVSRWGAHCHHCRRRRRR